MEISSFHKNGTEYGYGHDLIEGEGQHIKCRALLDLGSQFNMITNKLFSTWEMNLKNQNKTINGVGHFKKRFSKKVN